MDAIKIGDKTHTFRAPLSITVALEIHNYAVLRGSDANGSGARALAAAICLSFPSLAPPRLPRWTGDNQGEIGEICLDHLISVHRLLPRHLAQIVEQFDLLNRLRAGLPTEEDVKISVGN